MNGKILALLFTLALSGAASAADVGGANKFNRSTEGRLAVAYSAMPPESASHVVHYPYSLVAPASGALDSPGEARGLLLNRATSPVRSWMHKITTFFEPRNLAESCMARAVYFEARSESQLGQLAVATVILNRVKASKSSSSVCGVVYKGANRLNACQFSFACDGKPDVPDDMGAWNTALNITTLALTTDEEIPDQQMQIVANATYYHADYVDPYWSKSMNRLTKIGRHIFYSQG